jgi:hypothetical protein
MLSQMYPADGEVPDRALSVDALECGRRHGKGAEAVPFNANTCGHDAMAMTFGCVISS